MAELFVFRQDIGRCLLTVIAGGHWNVADVHVYEKALRQQLLDMAQKGVSLGEVRLLVDTRGHGVQSQEVIDALKAMRAATTDRVKKFAQLTSSALVNMQARRVNAQAKQFDDEDEAIAWLMTD